MMSRIVELLGSTLAFVFEGEAVNCYNHQQAKVRAITATVPYYYYCIVFRTRQGLVMSQRHVAHVAEIV